MNAPAGQVDLNEPLPFNQSLLLYNQPLAATVKGAEALDRSKGYEQFADVNARAGQASAEKAYLLRPPNLEKMQRTYFDKSLNDREALLAASLAQERAGNQFGASRNLKLQNELYEAQKQLLQSYHEQQASPQRPLSAQNPVNEPKEAEPAKQVPMKTDIQQFRMTGFSNTQT